MLTLVLIVAVFAAAAVVFSLHTMVVVQKYIDTVENWSQALSDDCNRNLQVYYGMLYDAMKKDVLAYFDKVSDASANVDADVAEYVEAVDVSLGSALKNND